MSASDNILCEVCDGLLSKKNKKQEINCQLNIVLPAFQIIYMILLTLFYLFAEQNKAEEGTVLFLGSKNAVCKINPCSLVHLELLRVRLYILY